MARKQRFATSPKGQLLFALIRVGGNLQQHLEALLEPLGITPLELQVMRVIGLNEWPSIASVARNVGVSKQAIQKPLRALREAGLLELGASQLDRRHSQLRLTVCGEERLGEALARLDEAELRFTRGRLDESFRLDTWLEDGFWELRPDLKPPSLRVLLRRALN